LYEKAAQASADGMTHAIEAAITPKTRVVAITWVHSSTGVKTPVRAIADVVAKANQGRGDADRILLCVDGVHGFGVESVTMGDLGCDFFAAGCHKWIFGPRGTGLVWGRATPSAWKRLRPVSPPFEWSYFTAREFGDPAPPTTGAMLSPGGFRAFEHRWALKEAFLYHNAIGKADIEARIHELAAQCKTGLRGMRHVTLHTPMDPKISAGLVCFEVAGMKPDAVVERLLVGGIVASTTPYRPSYARFTPGITNTPEEIDRALAAVRAMA
jgi:selenocysteine lyase/cysteine desulfurase